MMSFIYWPGTSRLWQHVWQTEGTEFSDSAQRKQTCYLLTSYTSRLLRGKPGFLGCSVDVLFSWACKFTVNLQTLRPRGSQQCYIRVCSVHAQGWRIRSKPQGWTDNTQFYCTVKHTAFVAFFLHNFHLPPFLLSRFIRLQFVFCLKIINQF